jgi:hypothetical protein
MPITVALSSTEAEYMCLSDTTRQIVWIESLFKDLNFDISNVALCGDNQGSIFLALIQLKNIDQNTLIFDIITFENVLKERK